ncbi:hypothetical protein CPC08DRAFT_823827 [Agrocybe pediades]|nr:hypothetical protein CPC08DRAFT_823827 [Agrocybe pediades]
MRYPGLALESVLRSPDCSRARKIAHDLKELAKTDHAKAQWTLRSNALRRKIANWIDVQHLYIPGLQIHRTTLAAAQKVEWCKSKARLDRWSEEVQLLKEERRRVLAFFEHRAREWDNLALGEGDSEARWMLPDVVYDETAIAGRHSRSISSHARSFPRCVEECR